jgi:hypothetical protein
MAVKRSIPRSLFVPPWRRLREVELLGNLSSDASTLPSYYEINASGEAIAEKFDTQNTYGALDFHGKFQRFS